MVNLDQLQIVLCPDPTALFPDLLQPYFLIACNVQNGEGRQGLVGMQNILGVSLSA